MGQVCDCLFRQQHHNRLDDLEKQILKYEELMEQWVANNSCYDLPNKTDKYTHIYR